jgi:hypothetical protein
MVYFEGVVVVGILIGSRFAEDVVGVDSGHDV